MKSRTGQHHILIGGDFGNGAPEAVAAIKADIDTLLLLPDCGWRGGNETANVSGTLC